MSTHNICLNGEKKKNYPRIITKYSLTIPLSLLYILKKNKSILVLVDMSKNYWKCSMCRPYRDVEFCDI